MRKGAVGVVTAAPIRTRMVNMENIIIIVIILIAAVFGVYSSIKHFKGQGGCCGGGGYKPKKKKLPKIIYEKKFKVDGMHCEHCKNRVEEIVNDIKGVAGRVNLKEGELTLLYAEDVDDELLKSRLLRAGYEITEVITESKKQ